MDDPYYVCQSDHRPLKRLRFEIPRYKDIVFNSKSMDFQYGPLAISYNFRGINNVFIINKVTINYHKTYWFY